MQPLHEKWLGVDFGLARVGVAVSDPLGMLARGLETIRWNGRDLTPVRERLAGLALTLQVDGIVLGYPERTDGRQGILTDQVKELADCLGTLTGKPVLLRDERYTTAIARRKLNERGISQRKQKPVIDQVAAEIILQEHLDSRRKAGY